MSTFSHPKGSTSLPLRPALRAVEITDEPASLKSSSTKVVSIAEPENALLASPEESTRIKQFPASVSSKRLTGRSVMASSTSSRLSLVSSNSLDDVNPSSDTSAAKHKGEGHQHKHHEHRVHQHDRLLSQVSEWLQKEKTKRAARKSKGQGSKHSTQEARAEEKVFAGLGITTSAAGEEEKDGNLTSKPRAYSQSSDSSDISLDRLQQILKESMAAIEPSGLTLLSAASPRRPSYVGRKRPSARKLGGVIGSSDTEYQDGDVVVPSCDVVLDNSKTMSYSGRVADSSSSTVTLSTSKGVEKERLAWLSFKSEIVKLAHTLRLKGWRRVPLDAGGDINVKRLSGALTNAVYVVSPPQDLPLTATNSAHKHKTPPKLLLRVYGPQVEHLIDRENELGILRRLARKKIGPRLLGTFKNGRFEEFFESQTLTAADLRVPDTSKQIGKRMRELHDGIDLLEREREQGPFVWLNWDKWVSRCEEVIKHLDNEVMCGKKRSDSKVRGLVCGVEWNVFRDIVEKYRKWLNEKYQAKGGVNKSLVFAHNDTQYGNILRLVFEEPTSGSAPSPLLLPQNTHKQLVVIDFEYASANTPGLEFANHFTEWCYNYHDAAKPWTCDTSQYPTVEEQRRFIRSYLNHRPQFNPRASATPKMSAMDGLAKGSISEFLLDSRTPGGSSTNLAESSYAEEEARREKETDRQVEEILQEIRVWRVANSAQWVAWGIVQAKVPELDQGAEIIEQLPSDHEGRQMQSEIANKPELKAEALLVRESIQEAEQFDGEEDEFDYLAYAQDRAMFFWGDVVNLGFVDKEQLPEKLVQNLKIVEY